ncbi:DNA polymerase subunit Cdc27 [Cokeromyces recurvatus]|uniref:DNA polymerase subunit Cdc27 n=1 Tax=Cokeromyces recurvatus TaxID=90255 RepID=UPI002220A48D|nr:DNA polymerase subunit Cdc27 [Cokeromyces recurvatus]KAI7906453.1 DNA polymerase subunit Cdc27 [Cokeromyces recurvatus]
MSDYDDYLNITVIQENKPVTYKSLARSLGIHVNTAKQVLYDFSKKQVNVHAVYCITGRVLQNNHFTIQLVKDSDLEETKKKYKEITGLHVYSLTSFNPDDFSILYTACKEAPRLAIEDRVKCGILKNTNARLKNIASNRLSEKKDQPVIKSNVTTNTINTKPIMTTTTPKSTTTTNAVKRKGTLSFGPATTKKQAISTPKANKSSAEQIEKTTASSKKIADEPKTKDENEKRMAKTSIKASDIFSDDEDEHMSKPLPIEDMKTEENDDDIVMEDVENNKEQTRASNENIQTVSNTTSSSSKTRKKVLKKKTTRNARGFLVTEEVWEWESADENETDSTPTTLNKPSKPVTNSSKNAAKKDTPTPKKSTAQSNLLSFFKKA